MFFVKLVGWFSEIGVCRVFGQEGVVGG
ncbi:hypothetical protein RCH17_002868, partial [Arthrobacter sp. MP_M7]|nr:hypothetical protein [Arthrobacter sp. MP_M4]MEC5204049.1 hypothetical protein [Arthrobacter sp. MP_M7]